MPHVVLSNAYKLKKGACEREFMLAVEKLSREYITGQPGYISFQLFADGDTWVDATTFETMEDAKRFAEACEPNELADHFYSFLDFDSCKTHYFTVRQSGK